MNSPCRMVSLLMFAMLAGFSLTHSQSFGNLETRFVFKLLQFSEGDNLGLAADVSTTSTYPCAGFGIQFRQFRSADTITVYIGGLIRPNPCFQTNDNAASKMFIGPMRLGKYVLRIYYRGVSDLYSLNIGRNRFVIAPLHIEFTEIEKL
mgnify:CR=1 FL=1